MLQSPDRVTFKLPRKQFFHEIFSRVVYNPHKIYFVRSDTGFIYKHLEENREEVKKYVDPGDLYDFVKSGTSTFNVNKNDGITGIITGPVIIRSRDLKESY